MKKHICICISMLLLIGVMAGCSHATSSEEKEPIHIVATIFPQYDWIREIIGEENALFEVTLLQNDGIDLHNYQPTAEDLVTLGASDLFVYVGGESDGWVTEALAQSQNQSQRSINLVTALGDAAKEEVLAPGMEAEEEESDSEEIEYDEHVWLSLNNAETLVTVLLQEIQELDPEHQEEYAQNASNYIQELNSMDEDFRQEIAEVKNPILFFGDRFPFRYLADDYNLTYYAPFSGCSAETEASFETIAYLAGVADKENLNSIFVLNTSDQKIAKTIIANTTAQNQQIYQLDSMESVTEKDLLEGIHYDEVMQENLKTIEEALE